MKKFLCSLLMMFSVLCAFPVSEVDGATLLDLQVPVTYGQTEARKMTSYVNDFRTGSDAWYWNSDNKTKTKCSDLGKLTYDYSLEKVAMQRAAEVAVFFQHVRPDGSDCFSAYDESGYVYYTAGENIAAGQTTYKEAFTAWQESDEKYSGQGHRRAMLDDGFNAIGLGHVIYNDCDIWVMELAYTPSINTTKTDANDSSKNVGISYSTSYMSSYSYKLSASTASLTVDKTKSLKSNVVVKSDYSIFSSDTLRMAGSTWKSSKSSVASVDSNGKVTAKKPGTATITATYANGKTATCKVTVTKAISSAKVTISKSKYTYTGSKIKPTVTVKLNGTKLKKDTDYTVSYSNNKSTGKATITVKGKGDYSGSVKKTFYIVPKKVTISSLKTSKKALTVKYKKATGASGYQIAYRKKGSSKWKTTTTTSLSKKVSKLTSKKTYQVKVRAYKTVSGTKHYGSYSKTKSIKVK